MDENEVDGQEKDTTVLNTDTIVLNHLAQEVPAGNYTFAYSYQVTSDTGNKDFTVGLTGSVAIDPMGVHLARTDAGAFRDAYFFNLSWEGGPFNLDMVMAKKDNTFDLVCDFAEFTLTRRS